MGNDPVDTEAMFRHVLAGGTCEEIAVKAGLTRGAVEQRVKKLAYALQSVVGVTDVDDALWPQLALMRSHREEYLEALSHYEPLRAAPRGSNAVPTDAQIDQLVTVLHQRSRHPQRDTAIVLVLFSTALRPSELGRLEVRDYLDREGYVRIESELRPEIAVDGCVRPLYFYTQRARAAVDCHLAERGGRGAYRGLDPHSPLFLVSQSGVEADGVRAMQGALRAIFRYRPTPGLTPMAARRYAANKLAQQGLRWHAIAQALGLRNAEAVRNLLQPGGPRVLSDGMRALVPSNDPIR